MVAYNQGRQISSPDAEVLGVFFSLGNGAESRDLDMKEKWRRSCWITALIMPRSGTVMLMSGEVGFFARKNTVMDKMEACVQRHRFRTIYD